MVPSLRPKEPFEVNIIDPCDEPVSLKVPASLLDTVIEYTLLDE